MKDSLKKAAKKAGIDADKTEKVVDSVVSILKEKLPTKIGETIESLVGKPSVTAEEAHEMIAEKKEELKGKAQEMKDKIVGHADDVKEKAQETNDEVVEHAEEKKEELKDDMQEKKDHLATTAKKKIDDMSKKADHMIDKA